MQEPPERMNDGPPPGRIPPHSLEAEVAILGACFLDPAAIDRVAPHVAPDHFYRQAHGLVFATILSLQERGEPVDLVTVCDAMKSEGTLDAAGGAAQLTAMVDRVPSAANVLTYAKIVRAKAIRRRVIRACSEIAARGYDDEPGTKYFADAEQAFTEAITGLGSNAFPQTVKQVFPSVLKVWLERRESPGVYAGLRTGFATLDRLVRGMNGGDLVIIGGATSMGKTSMGLAITENLALGQGVPGLCVSVEMTREQIIARLMARTAQFDLGRTDNGMLTEDDIDRIVAASSRYDAGGQVWVDEEASSIPEIASVARQLKRQHDIGFVMVDYVQLLECAEQKSSREQEVASVASGLKKLAKQLAIPVIALAQVSRKPGERKDPRPRLSDLRESGAIEQAADVVILLHREEYYETDPTRRAELHGKALAIVAKHRNGPVGDADIQFVAEQSTFTDADPYSSVDPRSAGYIDDPDGGDMQADIPWAT